MEKVIVLDLDGTLLRNDKTVSENSLRVLQRCKEAGYKIVLATARPPRIARNILPESLVDEYLIFYNGALVYKGCDIIYENHIPVASMKTIIRFFQENYPDMVLSLEIEDTLYSSKCVEKLFGKIPYIEVDYNAMKLRPAAKVLVDLDGVDDVEHITKHLPEDCTIVITDGGTLGQIMSASVSKLEAVQFILREWGYDMKDVIAFGDDYNDLELISRCGTGVAMENAVIELREAARAVTKTNDEDGVAYYLENYLLRDIKRF